MVGTTNDIIRPVQHIARRHDPFNHSANARLWNAVTDPVYQTREHDIVARRTLKRIIHTGLPRCGSPRPQVEADEVVREPATPFARTIDKTFNRNCIVFDDDAAFPYLLCDLERLDVSLERAAVSVIDNCRRPFDFVLELCDPVDAAVVSNNNGLHDLSQGRGLP